MRPLIMGIVAFFVAFFLAMIIFGGAIGSFELIIVLVAALALALVVARLTRNHNHT